MSVPSSKDFGAHYSSAWSVAYHEKRLDDALEFASRGYVISRDICDEKYVEVFRSMLGLATGAVFGSSVAEFKGLQEKNSVCLFCGQTKDSEQLFVGANGAICRLCVRQFFEMDRARENQ